MNESQFLGCGTGISFCLAIILLALSYAIGLNPGYFILAVVVLILFLGGLMMSGEEN